jgi:protein required for attachment to host cells
MKERTWILVAHAAGARLYQSEGRGEWILLRELEHAGGRAKGSELESDKPGRVRQSAGSRSAMEPHTPPKKKEVEKFARELAGILEHGAYSRLILVTPPAFLGVLRKLLSPRVKERVAAEVEKDYLHLEPREVRERVQEQMDAL